MAPARKRFDLKFAAKEVSRSDGTESQDEVSWRKPLVSCNSGTGCFW